MMLSQKIIVAMFWFVQVALPLLMFYLAYGSWGIGTSIIIMPPFLFSMLSIPWLLYKKRFRYLLGPVLTILLTFIIISMATYYMAEADKYVDSLAREMQAQCNRDGVCKLPAGDWQGEKGYQTLFHTHTKGRVPFSICLTFNGLEPGDKPDCDPCSNSVAKEPLEDRFTSFHLTRNLEDHNYHIYGGVDRPLTFWVTHGHSMEKVKTERLEVAPVKNQVKRPQRSHRGKPGRNTDGSDLDTDMVAR